MTAHRCAGGLKKKLNLRSGSQRNRHFLGFFNVPVLHRHGATLLNGDSEKPPHLVAIYDTLGIRGQPFNPEGGGGGWNFGRDGYLFSSQARPENLFPDKLKTEYLFSTATIFLKKQKKKKKKKKMGGGGLVEGTRHGFLCFAD